MSDEHSNDIFKKIASIKPPIIQVPNDDAANNPPAFDITEITRPKDRKSWVERNPITYGIIMAAVGAAFAVIFEKIFN